jgi:hypothetical protein
MRSIKEARAMLVRSRPKEFEYRWSVPSSLALVTAMLLLLMLLGGGGGKTPKSAI